MSQVDGREAVLSKTILDGRTAVITAGPGGHAYVYIDGAQITDGYILDLPEPVNGMRRAIGYPKRLLITDAEAAVIQQGMDRITAAYEAARLATPEGQRDDLAQAVGDAAARMERASVAASNRDDWSDYLPARAAFEAAEAELHAFDAAHPELAARLEADQAARDAELFRSGMNQ